MFWRKVVGISDTYGVDSFTIPEEDLYMHVLWDFLSTSNDYRSLCDFHSRKAKKKKKKKRFIGCESNLSKANKVQH